MKSIFIKRKKNSCNNYNNLNKSILNTKRKLFNAKTYLNFEDIIILILNVNFIIYSKRENNVPILLSERIKH